MAHLKRYGIPKFWPLSKKEKVWAVKPRPGPHPKDFCIPLQIIVRDILELAETSKEAKKIIKAKNILVDKKSRTDPNFPCGLMDVIEIPELKKYYRINVNKKGLYLEEIKKEDSDKKLCRIQNKTIVKRGLCQLNLHDGRNILVKDSKKYKTSDSLLIQLPDQKILKHVPFKEGSNAIVFSGKNIGFTGKIKKIIPRKSMLEDNKVILQTKEKEIETLKDYVFVIE